jgi:hypothetical protein
LPLIAARKASSKSLFLVSSSARSMQDEALNVICASLLLASLLYYIRLCAIGKQYVDAKHAHAH